jgi:hypothetical protein
VDHSSSVFAPQAAGAAGLSPAFQRREYPIEGFALKGRKIGAVVTGVEYCMKCPFLLRPYSIGMGEIPGVKTPYLFSEVFDLKPTSRLSDAQSWPEKPG